jgi:hypothetical protein
MFSSPSHIALLRCTIKLSLPLFIFRSAMIAPQTISALWGFAITFITSKTLRRFIVPKSSCPALGRSAGAAPLGAPLFNLIARGFLALSQRSIFFLIVLFDYLMTDADEFGTGVGYSGREFSFPCTYARIPCTAF